MKAPLKKPALWQNPLSLLGLLLGLGATAFGLPMMALDIFQRHTDTYLAVVIYLVLPFVGVGGLAIVLLGMWWEHRRRLRHPDAALHLLPKLDLNRPKHQLIVVGSLLIGMVAVILFSVTGYRAYHFTESVTFCGLVCHQVMKPEYTAYQHSPHARVACVQCHVGPGAGWFVRSKLSGAYQVYAVATKSYPKPIASPVKNLRPAQETCEQCHWPAKFFGAQQKNFMRYLTDEANTPWEIQMLIKVGGGDPKVGAAGGIHWHMNIAKEIAYIASDEKREVIPWVRVTDKDGKVTEYQSTEQPLNAEQVAKGPIRRMDCVDCHNRPSHIFLPPDKAVEVSLSAGRLDHALPFVKREAIRLLTGEYATEAEAKTAIRRGLSDFYQKEYPDLATGRAAAISQSAEEVARIFSTYFFPEMHSDWRSHPNHVGHLNSDGCFRCHDGLHKSAAGNIITKDCNTCHTILAQGPPEEVAAGPLKEQPFRHPVDVGMDVTEYKCSQCHTGTGGL
jgi:nitrate/TMAO reductase-like tetraheme cytochrome c subunit